MHYEQDIESTQEDLIIDQWWYYLSIKHDRKGYSARDYLDNINALFIEYQIDWECVREVWEEISLEGE